MAIFLKVETEMGTGKESREREYVGVGVCGESLGTGKEKGGLGNGRQE